MEDQEKQEQDVDESQVGSTPAQPQSPVKSRSDQVQETVDRQLTERAARQKITDEVVARRKQAAAVTSAGQMAKTGPGLANGLRNAADIVDSKTAEAAEAVQAANDAVPVVKPEPAANASVTEQVHLNLKEREQAEAANVAAAAVTSAEEPAESCTDLPADEARRATAAILGEVKKNADARELREIEMHNTMMDAIQEVTAQSQALCYVLRDIGGSMRQISSAIITIAGKA